MESKKISIPIYFGDFIIVKSEDLNEIGIKYGKDFDQCAAVVWRDYESKYLKLFVAIRPDAPIGTIAHECVHLVNHVFDYTGTRLDIFNDEPQAYLMGWFATQISNFIYVGK